MGRIQGISLAFSLCLAACGSSPSGPGGSDNPPVDPGSASWEPVPTELVAQECGLDPELLAAADAELGASYAIVRYGKLCHEYYPEGEDTPSEVFSATKTLAGVVTGAVAWLRRTLSGPARDPASPPQEALQTRLPG